MAAASEKSMARVGVYAFLLIAAAFFLMPLYVMVATSLKTMDEIRVTSIFALPIRPTLDAWAAAWSSACTGLTCSGLSVGFVNSLAITIPATFLSILLGAVTGYAFAAGPANPCQAVLGVRPEHFRIAPQDRQLALPFTVNVLESMGADSVIWGQIAGQKASIRVSSELKLRPARGTDMPLGFSLSSASLFDADSGERL
ncbi:MAG: TOBE domain-containing protein [Maritimibacter sp.]|nr:TOBE domain-containing protein [Maritimibacter sp.]